MLVVAYKLLTTEALLQIPPWKIATGVFRCKTRSVTGVVVAEVALCSVFALSARLFGVPVLCLSDDIFDVKLVSTWGAESIIAAVSATA